MSQVTHKVVKGDTLSIIAKKYGTTVTSIASLNNIKNTARIYVGQVLIIKGKTVTSSSSSGSKPNPNMISVIGFGLQSNSNNLIFIQWSWGKTNVEKYLVEWSYYTDNGKWFSGNNSDSDANVRESTYTAPNNAKKVRVRVKPVSKLYKDKKGKEVSYWTASWSTYREYVLINNPPGDVSAPKVEVENYSMTISNSNVDINAKEVEYEIVQNNTKVFKIGWAAIKTGSTFYKLNLTPGFEYKVRARGKRDSIRGNWSDYTENYKTVPSAPKSINGIKALSDDSIKISWDRSSMAETYTIEYAEKETYFQGSNAVTAIDNIENTTYVITGLTGGTRYFFRVKAVNDTGDSQWTSIVRLTLGKKPDPPTTWSDKTIAIAGDKVLLSWVHNTIDGSDQSGALIEFNVNGVIDTHTIGMDVNGNPINTFKLPTFMMSDGSVVKWRVKTKGITGVYSDWSIRRAINIHTPPTLLLELTDAKGGRIDTIKEFPFRIKGTPGPNAKDVITYYVSIKSKESYTTYTPFGVVNIRSGDEVYSKFIVASSALDLYMSASDVDLENNIDYEISCIVTMRTGLSVESKLSCAVKWDETYITPNAEILIDMKSLSASIRPYCESYEDVYKLVTYVGAKYIETDTELTGMIEGVSVDGVVTTKDNQVYKDQNDRLFYIDGTPRIVEISNVTLGVYRRTYDGEFVEIANDINGSKELFVTDPHPSLDYARYRIVSTHNATGAVTYVDVNSQPIDESSIVLQWDDSWSNFMGNGEELEDVLYTGGSMLRLPYNVSISETNSPDVNVVNYIGRSHPVSYYGTGLGVSSSWSTAIPKSDHDSLYAIRRLSMYMGDVYVREPSGVGYWANVKVSYDKAYNNLIIPITLNLVRVDGGI